MSKSSEATVKLKQYFKKGNLFHGSSKNDITLLTPRKPQNNTKSNDKFNSDYAIFASRLPQAAIIFACVSTTFLKSQNLSGIHSVGPIDETILAELPFSWKNALQKSKGFVYILPNNSFDIDGGWQVKSKSRVRPIDKIEVKFQDFEYLGGIINWTKE